MSHAFAFASLIAAIAVCLLLLTGAEPAPLPAPTPIQPLTAETCASAGGHWELCGSSCIGTGAQLCTLECDQQCQCGGIAGFACPAGYTCRLTGAYPDELGKCIPST